MAITKYKTDTSPCRTYRALLTQTGTQSSIQQFLVGETYTIISYVDGDDFSNIADVKSGTINQTGCVFVATGKAPNIWGSYEQQEIGSELESKGSLFAIELENTLGYPIEWYHRDPDHEQFGNGNYFAYSPVSGTSSYFQENVVLDNAFPAEKTVVSVETNYDSCDRVVYGITKNRDYLSSGVREQDSVLFVQANDASGPVDDRMKYVSVTIEIYP